MTARNMTVESAAHYVEVTNLVKWFGNDRAVDGISFSLPKGQFLTLLGPSGCGKTTTLMSIAGLHGIDSGAIRVGDVTYTSKDEGIFLPPEKRDIGMVFQSYAIWPHMTVAQNVAYPLEIRKVERGEIESRVADVLRAAKLRVHVDDRSETLNYKIRDGETHKVPYMAVVGQREAEAGTVAVRVRGEGKKQVVLPLSEFAAKLRDEVSTRALGPLI